MNYLKYIEFAPENLQFFLWLRDYRQRFAQLSPNEAVLSPEWTLEQAEAEAQAHVAANKSSRPPVNAAVADVFKGTDFAVEGKPKVNSADPFDTPDKTPSLDEKRDVMSEYGSSTGNKTNQSNTTHQSVADNAFEEAGVKLKPCKSLSSAVRSVRC
jgi:hypothetical protein